MQAFVSTAFSTAPCRPSLKCEPTTPTPRLRSARRPFPYASQVEQGPRETSKAPSSSGTASPFSLPLLNLVTIVWGSQHAVTKLAVSSTSPSTAIFLRFLLASLLVSPSLPALPSMMQAGSRRIPTVWKRGLELSVWMFLGYAFQSIGLETTTAARSGFLLYLNVKFVPILARVLYGREISKAVWASAALALTGTILLGYDGSAPNVGDGWSIAAAISSAMFILRMETAAEEDAGEVNAVSLLGVAILSAGWVARNGIGTVDAGGLWEIGYLAVVCTAVCNFLQAVGQRGVRAERAAVVFAMDPVYGAGFAYLLLGERLGWMGIGGAGLVAVAAAVSGWGIWKEGIVVKKWK